jgi:hypothetical protein
MHYFVVYLNFLGELSLEIAFLLIVDKKLFDVKFE